MRISNARMLLAGAMLVPAVPHVTPAQLTPAPGYAVQQLPAPGTVQGGVVRRGNALIVGQGEFGPGLQSIVRLEAGRATTIATGFGGMGGFDLAEDGTLYVVDNCYTGDFGCEAATTGDTVYAIPEALHRTTAIDAADAAMLPAGSIAFPFDVLSTPLGLLVSDAVGPGAGRVLQVEAGGATPVITGLDYAAGLAYDAPTLWVGSSNPDFTGSLFEFTGTSPAGALVDDLPGMFGVAVDGDGQLLVTGGAGALLAVDEVGDTSERATGFSFPADVVYDPVRDAALLLDFGATAVTVVCTDADGDGVCDGDCSDGVALERASLVVKAGKAEGKGSLALKGRLRIDGGLAADPTTDGLRLQVADADGTVVLDVILPSDDRWTEMPRERGWRFRDAAGSLAITGARVSFDRKEDDTVKVALQSRKHGTFAADALALPLRATVTFDADGECASHAFAACRTRGKTVRCS
jgi:hypothetical protein